MNTFLKIASLIAMVMVTIPSVLLFAGSLDLETVKMIALVGTVVWFVVTPFWMGREPDIDAKEVEI